MDLIERALSDAIKHLVAHGDRSPYPDDPRWSPWTRFEKPLIDKLVAARDQHRGAVSVERERIVARVRHAASLLDDGDVSRTVLTLEKMAAIIEHERGQ